MQTTGDCNIPDMSKLAFTITDTHLILGTEPAIEQAIRTLSGSASTSMASAKWFNKAKSAIPTVVGLACLEDNAAVGELFWWMMKKSGENKDSNKSIGPNPGLMFSQAGSELANPNLLPPFDAVRKYFGSSAFYGISRSDGFFFEFKYLNPNGTN